MKKTLAMLLVLALAAVIPVTALAAQSTDSNPAGRTEVTARVESAAPGDVTYTITIPDVVDFGTLTQPADGSSNSFKDAPFGIAATSIEGLDPDNQVIAVYVKDEGAVIGGDTDCYIVNKSDPSVKFSYDVYDTTDTEQNDPINVNNVPVAAGYYLGAFTNEGEQINGLLRLNQLQLYGASLAEIVGDYSGYMEFFTCVENN